MNKILFVLLIAILSFNNAIAQKLPPTPTKYLTDKVNIVDVNYYDSITNILADLEDKTGVQFLIYIVDTLNGENLEDYTSKLFNHWKLGQKGKDNGVLLAIFFEDRKFRFEIGYGLEGKLPDLKANNIQYEYLIPEFKNRNYGLGLLNTAKAISDVASDYYFDYFGKKIQIQIDSLIVADKANVLTDDSKNQILQYLKSDYILYNDEITYNYFYFRTSSANNLQDLKNELKQQWDSIVKLQPEFKTKTLIGISSKLPIYAIIADEIIKKQYTEFLEGEIENQYYGSYLKTTWENQDFHQLFRTISNNINEEIEYNSFKKQSPIYAFFFANFYENKTDFMYSYYGNLIYSAIVFVVSIPILLILILSLLAKEMSYKAKSIVLFWSLLNCLLIPAILGYFMNISLIRKITIIRKKKGGWEDILKKIEAKSYLGNIAEFITNMLENNGGGSGGGTSYSSSRSSSSSYSSSRSSSSSSSSSSSFGGGGGGRSGGGGSSGSW